MTMPSDSPMPPERVPAIVDSLEPDLAAAYRAGNTVVIQAVSAGATTTAMVVNDMIRQGAITGLPPGVQELVSARIKEMQEQQNAENDRLRKLAAAVAGAAIMATAPAEGMYYGGEGNPDRDMWRDRSSAELAQMSYQDWSKLSEGQKQGLMAETTDRAQTLKTEAGTALNAIIENIRADSALKGLSEEQNTERTRDILMAITHTVNHDDLDLKTAEGLAAARANIAKLKPEDQPLALKALDAYAAAYHGQAAEDKMTATGQPGATDHDKYGLTTGANRNIAIGTQHIEQARTPVEQRAAYDQSDRAMQQDARAAGGTVGTDNLAVGAKVDGAAAKADLRTDAGTAGLGFDDAPPTAPAAPRLTINAAPLAAAGMIQPEGVALAANDPKGAAPEPERQRVAPPAQGMGT